MRTGDFTQDVPKSSNARAGAATNELHNAARGTPPPPPPHVPPMSIKQLLAMQNKLMRVLTENLVQRVVPLSHHQLGVETSYTDFLMTHSLTFVEAVDWLRIIESKFGLLHCT
jgi:hypothetical protein